MGERRISMEKRVYAYDAAGEYQGYVRLDTDEVGNIVGEVYDTQADKLGAVRYEPLNYEAQESLVFDPDGDRIGFVQLEQYENEQLGGEIYWVGELETKPQVIAHVHLDENDTQRAKVHKKAEWGELIGSLKPENVTDEELVLVGGGSALLILL